jgi:hypothetical protein
MCENVETSLTPLPAIGPILGNKLKDTEEHVALAMWIIKIYRSASEVQRDLQRIRAPFEMMMNDMVKCSRAREWD